jgi:hypothetical protein
MSWRKPSPPPLIPREVAVMILVGMVAAVGALGLRVDADDGQQLTRDLHTIAADIIPNFG